VAAMPSFGRIKQLSIVALAAGFLGVAASSASAANPIWLWACHDPNGGAVTDLGSAAVPHNADKACAQEDQALTNYDDGMRTSLPAGRDASSWRLDVPPSFALQEVRIHRRTTELGTGQRYELETSTGVLESRDPGQAPFNGAVNFTPTAPATNLGSWVRFGLTCAVGCSGPAAGTAGADAAAVGLKVLDESAPSFAVGGTRSPLTDAMSINVQATDTGSGLRSAVATLGGVVVSGNFDGNDDCRDLTPATESIDMSINADCAEVDSLTLSLQTKNVIPDGNYTLTVAVVDWAGNVSSSTQPIQVLNTLPANTPTQTLSIGTSGITQQGGSNNQGGGGGVAGASSQQCRSPRLSVFLAQKPLRVRRGLPVLRSGKRYRFNGRLTCVINGRRRSAPKRTRIDILNTVGKRKRTIEKAGTTIRNKGRLTVILAYKSSRLITFRFTNSDGQRSQVRIRIRVAKR
jgi:hypothetical protein